MIRYRFPGLDLAIGPAAACQHPRLQRLDGCGPWTAAVVDGVLQLEQVVTGWRAEGWSPWQARSGYDYQVATNLDISLLRRRDLPPEAVWTRFACGLQVPIPPAFAEGLDIDPSGQVLQAGPGAYIRALDAFMDKGAIATFSDALPVIYEAIKTGHTCTPDLCHELRLVTTADVPRVIQIAYGTVGKADPASDG